MRLRTYIVIGYLVSMVITIVGLITGLKQMLIATKDTTFILTIAFIATLADGIVNMLLLTNPFSSLKKLKAKMKTNSQRQFDQDLLIQTPVEFKNLEKSFNQMALELESSFNSLAESEQEKSLMIAQLSHDIKMPLISIQAAVEVF